MLRLASLSLAAIATIAPYMQPATCGASTLATTSFAYDDGSTVWQGVANFAAVETNVIIPFVFELHDELEATMEFAAFAPGDFQGFLDENGIVPAVPISAPSEFIYAYQLTSITTATSGILSATVGLDGNEVSGLLGVLQIPTTDNYGTYAPLPTNDSDAQGGGPGVSTSSQWDFVSSQLLPGDTSTILYFSNPAGPEWDTASLQSGIAGDSQLVASPAPEPGTLTISLLIGMTTTFSRRMLM